MVHREAIQKMIVFIVKRRFDKTINKVKVISAGNGKCSMEIQLEDEHTDARGALHNGLSGVLIDVASYLAFITHPRMLHGPNASPDLIPMCTIESYISYQGTVRVGEEIRVDAHTVKTRGLIGFMEVSILNKATADVLRNLCKNGKNTRQVSTCVNEKHILLV